MKSILSRTTILIVVGIIIIAFNFVNAAGATRPFGGVILNTKATEIQSLENSNYRCTVPGTTITIRTKGSPAGTPTTFLIPAYVKSKTGTTPRANQTIKGLYSNSKTSITCIYQGTPPSTTTTTLTPITMFGTSR